MFVSVFKVVVVALHVGMHLHEVPLTASKVYPVLQAHALVAAV